MGRKRGQWRENLVDKIDKAEGSRRVSTANNHRSGNRTSWGKVRTFIISDSMMELLRKAAQERGIAMSGYVRRAIARQVAIDLGISALDVLRETPYPSRYGNGGPPADKREKAKSGLQPMSDDGTGYGDWDLK